MTFNFNGEYYLKKSLRRVIIWTVFTFCVSVVIRLNFIPDTEHIRASEIECISMPEFNELVDEGRVQTLYYSDSSANIYGVTTIGTYFSIQNPYTNDFRYDVLDRGVMLGNFTDFVTAEKVENERMGYLGAFITLCLIIILFQLRKLFICYKQLKAERKFLAEIRKSKASTSSNLENGDAEENSTEDIEPKSGFIFPLPNFDFFGREEDKPESAVVESVKTFDDIAGLHEVKKDVECLVDFLKNKEKYTEAGAVLPRGIILYGPPGTGKTLLAKAIAGEAGVPFLYKSGSDFIEMYVGVGPKRIRELFAEARKKAPCIVFIDEIDAIARKRTGNDHGEDRKTINALLAEMDGFTALDNVLVIGATNRLEDLDPALMRPGRFTDKYCVPVPETVNERLEVIDIYTKNKKLAENFDLHALAKETVGFSPAKIEALLNEAAIISVQDGIGFITKEIIDKAMYKVLLNGHQKEDNSERALEELNIVAWHEAGHALVGRLFGKDVTKVTITQSTSGAGGVTFSTPLKTSLLSSEDIKHEIMELYGGRVGELFYYNGDRSKITTGASNDIERATALITEYVTKYGMSTDLGMVNLEVCGVDKDFVMRTVSEIAKKVEQDTIELIEKHKEELTALATLLVDSETIYAKDIESIVAVETC